MGLYTLSGQSVPVLITFVVKKKMFSCYEIEFHVFQFVPITSFPVSGHYWEQFDFYNFIPSHQGIIYAEKIPLRLFFPSWAVPKLSASPYTNNAPIPKYLRGPVGPLGLWDLLHVHLVLRTAHSTPCHLISAAQRGRSISLKLQGTYLKFTQVGRRDHI